MQNDRKTKRNAHSRLLVEPLESRLMMTVATASLAAYHMGNMPEPEWMVFSDDPVTPIALTSIGQQQQSIANVLPSAAPSNFTRQTDLDFTIERDETPRANGIEASGFCGGPNDCTLSADGYLYIEQEANRSNTLRIESNAMHQWVVEIDDPTSIGANEHLDVFGVTEMFSPRYSVLPTVVKTLESGDYTPNVGDLVTFEIEVTNSGSNTATNVLLDDLLPAELTPTGNNGATLDGSYDPTTGLWTIGTLNAGSTATLTLEGTLNAGQAGYTITIDDPETLLFQNNRVYEGYASGAEYVVPERSMNTFTHAPPTATFSVTGYVGVDAMDEPVRGQRIEDSSGLVRIITEPAANLFLRYGTGNAAGNATIRIGRLDLGITDQNMTVTEDPATGVYTAAAGGPIQRDAENQQGMAIGRLETANGHNDVVDVFSVHDDGTPAPNTKYYITRSPITPEAPTKRAITDDPASTDYWDADIEFFESVGRHLGALDHYSDGGRNELWVGRFGTAPGVIDSSVLKIELANGNYLTPGGLTANDVTEYVVQDSYASTIPGAEYFSVFDIDATTYDGTYIWASAYISYSGVRNGYGIVRFTPDDVTNELTNAIHVATMPHGFPPPPAGLNFSYAQGLRVLPSSNGTPTRLYGIFSNLQNAASNVAYSGIYEFDISDGNNLELMNPTRTWHIQQSGSHLEGFDFVPWHPSQIFYSEANGNNITRIELNDLFADNDVNGDGAVDTGDYDFLTDAVTEDVASLEYDFNGDGTFSLPDVAAFNVADLNRDGEISAGDIDFLKDRLGEANNLQYDYNGDGMWSVLDLTAYVEDILNTFLGDANVDGLVDSGDLGALLNNFFQSTDSWADGNFNLDSMVNSSDLGPLLNHFGDGYNADFVGFYFIYGAHA